MGDAWEIRVPLEKAQHQNRKPSTYVSRPNKHQFCTQNHLLEQHLYSTSYALLSR